MRICLAHEQGRTLVGELPDGVELMVADLPTPGDRVEFWVPPFLAPAASAEAVRVLATLRVVQLLTAGVDSWLGRLPDHVTLCNARGAHSSSTAEWVLAVILAFLRDLPSFTLAQAQGCWAYHPTGELAGKRVLIVGAGDVGEAVAARLSPFDVSVTMLAKRARAGVHGADALAGLLPWADIVVVIVPLTPATLGLVDSSFLAAMPDGALLVNAARGPVVNTAALTEELVAGRISAALDVTDPEPLPPGHPLWRLPNVLITPHVAASVTTTRARAYALVGGQIRRYASGQPLINIVSGDY